MDDRFWDDLFRNSTAWGLSVYLQDWLSKQVKYMPQLKEDLSLERDWLIQMGSGAEKHNVNILYCAAQPRQMLQSVEIQNVVSIRASGDYQPSNKNWMNGLSDIWAYALGLSPFKDTFWSEETEDGNPAYTNMTETHASLEAAFATLSTGTVAISDESKPITYYDLSQFRFTHFNLSVGKVNSTLVNRSITPDGLVLKPSRPLATPDYLISSQSKDDNVLQFETFSEISGWRFGIILVYSILPRNVPQPLQVFDIKNYKFYQGENYVTGVYKNDANSFEYYNWSPDSSLKTTVQNLTVSF